MKSSSLLKGAIGVDLFSYRGWNLERFELNALINYSYWVITPLPCEFSISLSNPLELSAGFANMPNLAANNSNDSPCTSVLQYSWLQRESL